MSGIVHLTCFQFRDTVVAMLETLQVTLKLYVRPVH
jgi:hypothetical protein